MRYSTWCWSTQYDMCHIQCPEKAEELFGFGCLPFVWPIEKKCINSCQILSNEMIEMIWPDPHAHRLGHLDKRNGHQLQHHLHPQVSTSCLGRLRATASCRASHGKSGQMCFAFVCVCVWRVWTLDIGDIWVYRDLRYKVVGTLFETLQNETIHRKIKHYSKQETQHTYNWLHLVRLHQLPDCRSRLNSICTQSHSQIMVIYKQFWWILHVGIFAA